MNQYKFYFPLQVRYGDLDPQWHVNNANFLTYLEFARFNYMRELKLFDGKSFMDLGLIVADIHITYLAPIDLTHKVKVGCRTTRIGTKSLTFAFSIEEEGTGMVFATAENVMVAYDYHTQSTKPVPDEWRKILSQYEGVEF